MIPHGVEVFVVLDPIDMRLSFDRLSSLIAGRLGNDVRGGALFVFFGKRRDALKLIFADATGLCLFYKRLDRRTFRIPEPLHDGELVVAIEERVLDDLLDGVDLQPKAPKSAPRPIH